MKRILVALVGLLAILLQPLPAATAAGSGGSIVFIRSNQVWISDGTGAHARRLTSQGTAAKPFRYPSESDDGTIVVDNRIENIKAGPGGTGQYGNAINAFRANNVIVRGNRIRDCDYSGVRGNSASNIQIVGNTVTDAREVALYSEFAFEGAIIANNVVDGCSTGVSVANFNEGGRLAIVQGNIIRNTKTRRYPGSNTDHGGVGIYVEADSNVTGNVIENAPYSGISVGWGRYMRDVSVVGNVVRNARYGVAVSVSSGAGNAVISGNLISGSRNGAIVGMDHAQAVSGDLSRDPQRFANLQISGNQTR